jgi:hypothetical protein
MTSKAEQVTPSSVEKFLDKEVESSILVQSFLLFITLCIVNIPFALFYTTLFIYFNNIKDTNPELYKNFIIGSCTIFAYFLLLGLTLLTIYTYGGINLHPTTNERPYFYFL